MHETAVEWRAVLTEEATAEHDGVQGDEDGPNIIPIEYVFIRFSDVAVAFREGVEARIV
jgi:hypothetical protein